MSCWGRHTLLIQSGARLSRHENNAEGPSSLKVQRMTHNAGTKDGVTKTVFYMAMLSGIEERDPLIREDVWTKMVRSVSALIALTLCRVSVPV